MTETRAALNSGWQKVKTTYNVKRLVERVYDPVVVASAGTSVPSTTPYGYTLYDELDRVFETGRGQLGFPDLRRSRIEYDVLGRTTAIRNAVGTALEQVTESRTYSANGRGPRRWPTPRAT